MSSMLSKPHISIIIAILPLALLTACGDRPLYTPPPHGLIAFTSEQDGNREIYIMNANGSGLTRLTNHPSYDSEPTWSPDGKQIAFISSRDGIADIYIMDADRSSVTRVHKEHPEFDSSPTWTPAPALPDWSPDGRQIVFQLPLRRDGADGWDFAIYVINVDGSGAKRLTDRPGSYITPTWSPDGQRIAFVSDRKI